MIFFEETHNKLRRLINNVGEIRKGAMELERPLDTMDGLEFIQHPFIKKYSNLVKFSEDMMKLVEEARVKCLEENVVGDQKLAGVQKNFIDLWSLLHHIFSYEIG